MLYPWEWFWHEEGGKAFFRNMADPTKRGTVWIEPPYKAALLGNKALLPVLWKLFGDDPERGKYLLPGVLRRSRPAARDADQLRQKAGVGPRGRLGHPGPRRRHDHRQPLRVRRRTAVSWCRNCASCRRSTALEGTVHPVIGSWLIDGEPAGMGIREGLGVDGLVTKDRCYFVPHTVESDGSSQPRGRCRQIHQRPMNGSTSGT